MRYALIMIILSKIIFAVRPSVKPITSVTPFEHGKSYAAEVLETLPVNKKTIIKDLYEVITQEAKQLYDGVNLIDFQIGFTSKIKNSQKVKEKKFFEILFKRKNEEKKKLLKNLKESTQAEPPPVIPDEELLELLTSKKKLHVKKKKQEKTSKKKFAIKELKNLHNNLKVYNT